VVDLRLAELVTALSLATDLGMGQPMEHALRTCLLSLRLGEALGLRSDQLKDVYYVALLRFLGCTADAHETAAAVGGDDIAFRATVAPILGGSTLDAVGHIVTTLGRGQWPLDRARAVTGALLNDRRLSEGVTAHCELAENLARRLGLSGTVRRGLAHSLERWDGHGLPGHVKGENIELSSRIVFLARDVDVLHGLGDEDEVSAIVRRRTGAAYDPAIVDALERCGPVPLDEDDAGSAWDRVIDAEPEPRARVRESELDRVLEVFADFVDLKSPFTVGHSRGVAALAEASALRLGLPAVETTAIRRAALVHDLGNVGVPNGILDRPGPLSDAQWERVRLHSYYTERILARPPALAPLASIAGMVHERLDGSGYHRGGGAVISNGVRLLAIADAYKAMTEPRAYRSALKPEQAAAQVAPTSQRDGSPARRPMRCLAPRASAACPRGGTGPRGSATARSRSSV
jgi:HD-GYP domain-containing protein (c-di-GMP phosphodiesterase class II)